MGAKKIMTKGLKVLPLKKLGGVVAAYNPTEVFYALIDLKRAKLDHHQKMEQIYNEREIIINTLEAEKDVMNNFMKKSFEERGTTLNAIIQMLHTAVESKNSQLTSQALGALVSVLEVSPIEQFESFKMKKVNGEEYEL